MGAAHRRRRRPGDVYDSAVEEYAAHLESTITHPLVGLKVVLDCAEGAAHAAGPRALEDAGATVIAIHADPDGLNINDNCGSTHLESLQAAVVEHGAHAGFALDGDADRCLAVDAEGNVVDGDQLLAILSLSLLDQGRLAKDTVVATVMSNLGFVQAMRANGVGVRQTKVGDRYVLEAMKVSGYSLGGEQSGHVIMSDHATTGDGILTTLHVMERMATTGKSLAELASVMTRLPQVLLNVRGRRQDPRRRGRRAGRRRRRGGGGAGRPRPDPAAALGHRADRARDGRGAHPRRGPGRRVPARRRGEAASCRCRDDRPGHRGSTGARPSPPAGSPSGTSPSRSASGWCSLPCWSSSRPARAPTCSAAPTCARRRSSPSVRAPVPDEVDQPLTTYDLRWSDGGDVRTATFRRSGPPDREVGDTWTLWVSPDGSVVETSSPLATWLWLGIGLPAFVLLIGVIVRWRGRAMARAVHQGGRPDRGAAARAAQS